MAARIESRRLAGFPEPISGMGLGCMGMSQSSGVRDDEESVRTVHRALDLDITFFDTADVYGAGDNELLLGRALGARRRDVVLASKCGLKPDERGIPVLVDGRPEHILAACDRSLQ